MSHRVFKKGDNVLVTMALENLRDALRMLKRAGAVKTAARVRLAISSAKGAVRNIEQLRSKAERTKYVYGPGCAEGRGPGI